MNTSPVKSILLPAMLTGGAVFYLLASFVISSQFKPDATGDTMPTTSPQYALREQQRNLAIRNVGFCILAGTGSGLAVAAGIRRWHLYRKQAQKKQQAFSGQISEFLSSRPE